MEIDLELYRKDVRVSVQPLVRLSVIDIAPDYPEHTMLFLHGFGGQARQWKYQLQAFSASNRVIAIDLRGHGRSDQPRGLYSMDVIQADLDGVLDTLGINEKIILAGHSFGGTVATEFAVSRPQRIKQLILIATAGKYQLNRLYRLLLRLPGITIRSLAAFTRGWLSAPPTVLKDWYEDNLSQWNGWSKFQEVKAPTLVIRGHRDRVFQKPQFEDQGLQRRRRVCS